MTDALSPPEFSDAAVTRSLSSFLALYGDTHLLLVRIDAGDDELALGLGTTAVRGGEGLRVKPAAGMEFHTVLHNAARGAPAMRSRGLKDDPASLVALLKQGHYFALPLRKRGDADALFMDRISVGRARNKDIVLRHPSISKFHAWFELDETDGFQVADSGSKNLTRVNGEALPAKEQRRVESGDVVRFGSVECVLSSPQTLWSAVRLFGNGR